MNDNNNTQRTEEVLKSLEGMKRAKPRPELYANIEAEFNLYNEVSDFQLRWVAAIAILLLVSNIYIVQNFILKSDTSTANTITEVSDQYNLNNDFNLYK